MAERFVAHIFVREIGTDEGEENPQRGCRSIEKPPQQVVDYVADSCGALLGPGCFFAGAAVLVLQRPAQGEPLSTAADVPIDWDIATGRNVLWSVPLGKRHQTARR